MSISFADHNEKTHVHKLTRKSLSTETKLKSNICFFYNEKSYTSDEKQKTKKTNGLSLHCITSLNRDHMTRQYVETGKTKLIAKPSKGDAPDACYQHKRMAGFTNLYRTFVDAGYNIRKKQTNKDRRK